MKYQCRIPHTIQLQQELMNQGAVRLYKNRNQNCLHQQSINWISITDSFYIIRLINVSLKQHIPIVCHLDNQSSYEVLLLKCISSRLHRHFFKNHSFWPIYIWWDLKSIFKIIMLTKMIKLIIFYLIGSQSLQIRTQLYLYTSKNISSNKKRLVGNEMV